MPPSLNPPPKVWALQGHRVGDNAQVRALVEGLGWPHDVKTLTWRQPKPLWTPVYGRRRTLAPLHSEARADIAPPWPDLVLAIGWRSVPVARWIAAQSSAAHVHLGRPRASLSAFDLVLTTPQYGLPAAPNVVRLPGPLGGPSADALTEAADTWRNRLAHLPRPWTALLVGGKAPPLVLPADKAAALGQAASAMACRDGGSLLVATGPRTGPTATKALTEAINAPVHLFTWGAEAENPYLAYLALADAFIVTGDSISMLHEASQTGRPLHIFDLPTRAWPPSISLPSHLPGLDTLRRHGLTRAPRRAALFSDALIRAGRAVRLGDPWPGPPPSPPPDPLQQAIRAVHEMMQARH